MVASLVGVDEECLNICIDWKARRQKRKLPDGAFLHYYTCYVFYYTHYFLWLNRIVGSCATPFRALPATGGRAQAMDARCGSSTHGIGMVP